MRDENHPTTEEIEALRRVATCARHVLNQRRHSNNLTIQLDALAIALGGLQMIIEEQEQS